MTFQCLPRAWQMRQICPHAALPREAPHYLARLSPSKQISLRPDLTHPFPERHCSLSPPNPCPCYGLCLKSLPPLHLVKPCKFLRREVCRSHWAPIQSVSLRIGAKTLCSNGIQGRAGMKQLLKSFGGRSRTEMAVFFPGPLMPRGVSLGRYMET